MGLEATSPEEAGLAHNIVSVIGRSVSWLLLALVTLTFSIVVLRYGFDLGWVWLQESVTWLHATIFLLASAWAFQTDDHVRVDIFYRTRSQHHRDRVNLAGCIVFLAPFCLFLLWSSWDYVAASWATGEASRETGGLPAIYLLKSLILLMPVLMLLQVYSTAKGCWKRLRAE